MTEYTKMVEDFAILEKAEEWAAKVLSMHTHSLNSMYYDTRPDDTKDGRAVTDIEYNSGLIKRYQNNKLLYTFGDEPKGEDLITLYFRKGK
jgi:uncharacterized Rossmann fold enzyme